MVSIFSLMEASSGVEELEVPALVGGRLDDLGRLLAAVAAQRVHVDRHGVLGAGRHGLAAHDLDLAVAVEGEAIQRDHYGHAEELHVLDLLGEVLAALGEGFVVLGLEQLGVDRQAAVHLEGAHRAVMTTALGAKPP